MSPVFFHLEPRGAVAWMELRGGRANEVGRAALEELEALLPRLESGEFRALVSWSRRRTARGTPVFSAGADVAERRGWSRERVLAHVRWQRSLLRRLARIPCFHLVVVGGVALGWGSEFLLAADYALAAPGASFGFPETGLGIVPGAGGTALLARRLGRAQALRLGFAGERVGAEEALRLGLVQELLPGLDEALERAGQLADLAASRSPTAAAAFKGALLAQEDGLDPWEAEDRAYAHCLAGEDPERAREAFGREPVKWGPYRPFGEE